MTTPTKQQLTNLQGATKEYLDAERTRLKNEVQVLQAILAGRSGGRGLQLDNTATLTAVAQKDIENYLVGT